MGLLSSYNQGNGILVDYGFNENGQLDALAYLNPQGTGGPESLLEYSYSYDNAGNMIQRNADSYGYDGKGQLITASLLGDGLAEEVLIEEAQAQYANQDILGQQRAEEIVETVSLDVSASSITVDYTYPKRIYRAILTPENPDHRVEARHLAVYTGMYNNEGYYTEAEDAQISIDEISGAIVVEFAQPIYARFLKIHCHFNEMDSQGNSVNALSSFHISDSNAVEAYGLVGGRNEFYIYDSKGNRESRTVMSDAIHSTNYAYYANSDLLHYDTEYTYNYDANGNMTEKGNQFSSSAQRTVLSPEDPEWTHRDDAVYWRYEWDLKNRLRAVYRYNAETDQVELAASYRYDINGQRVSRIASGEETHYVFDLTGKVLEEITGSNVVTYVFLKDRHLARIEGAEILYYGTDHLNSTVLMTDENGAVVWSGDSTPFGDYSRVTSDNYEDLSLKYTGKDIDPATGLYYLNARWYDSENGRFMSEDPIRDGLHWYAYVNNNPVNYVDPTGLFTKEEYIDLPENPTDLDSTDFYHKYTAQDGDSLWKLAEEHYGDGNMYLDIARFNGIEDPDRIQIGQEILVPYSLEEYYDRMRPSLRQEPYFSDATVELNKRQQWVVTGAEYYIGGVADFMDNGIHAVVGEGTYRFTNGYNVIYARYNMIVSDLETYNAYIGTSSCYVTGSAIFQALDYLRDDGAFIPLSFTENFDNNFVSVDLPGPFGTTHGSFSGGPWAGIYGSFDISKGIRNLPVITGASKTWYELVEWRSSTVEEEFRESISDTHFDPLYLEGP